MHWPTVALPRSAGRHLQFLQRTVFTVQAGEEVLDLGAGDFLSIPPGVAHTLDNLHNGPWKLSEPSNVMTPG